MFIDDTGSLGAPSDHNWICVELRDNFVHIRRVFNSQSKKEVWNISEKLDWSLFKQKAESLLVKKDFGSMSVDELAGLVSGTLLSAGKVGVGIKTKNSGFKKPSRLPPYLVEDIKLKKSFESDWKTASTLSASNTETLQERFVVQKQKVQGVIQAIFCTENQYLAIIFSKIGKFFRISVKFFKVSVKFFKAEEH